MKKLALTFAIALSAVNLPCFAGTVYFAPDGGTGGSGAVEAVLPLEKLGSVDIPRGTIAIKGDLAEIDATPEWQFDKHRILYGQVLDTRIKAANGKSTVSGVMFLDQGEWLKYFDKPDAIEEVVTANGRFRGRIESIQNGTISLRGAGGNSQSIKLADVTTIRSPRSFTFSIPLSAIVQGQPGTPSQAESKAISVESSATPFRLAALKTEVRREMADGDLSMARLIGIGTAVNLIQLGQLAPYIVLPTASAHQAHMMKMRQLNFVTGQ